MKEAYEKPEVEVVMFDKDDIATVVTMSGGTGAGTTPLEGSDDSGW